MNVAPPMVIDPAVVAVGGVKVVNGPCTVVLGQVPAVIVPPFTTPSPLSVRVYCCVVPAVGAPLKVVPSASGKVMPPTVSVPNVESDAGVYVVVAPHTMSCVVVDVDNAPAIMAPALFCWNERQMFPFNTRAPAPFKLTPGAMTNVCVVFTELMVIEPGVVLVAGV